MHLRELVTERMKIIGAIVGIIVIIVSSLVVSLRSNINADQVPPSTTNTPQYSLGAAVDGFSLKQPDDIEYTNSRSEGKVTYAADCLANAQVKAYASEFAPAAVDTTTDSNCRFFFDIRPGTWTICTGTTLPNTLSQIPTEQKRNCATEAIRENYDNYVDLVDVENTDSSGVATLKVRIQEENHRRGTLFVNLQCQEPTSGGGTEVHLNDQGFVEYTTNVGKAPNTCEVNLQSSNGVYARKSVSLTPRTTTTIEMSFNWDRLISIQKFLDKILARLTTQTTHAAPSRGGSKVVTRPSNKTRVDPPKPANVLRSGIIQGSLRTSNNVSLPGTIVLQRTTDIIDENTGLGLPEDKKIKEYQVNGDFSLAVEDVQTNKNNEFKVAKVKIPNSNSEYRIVSVKQNGNSLPNNTITLGPNSQKNGRVTPYETNGILITVELVVKLTGEAVPDQTYSPALNTKGTFIVSYTAEDGSRTPKNYSNTSSFDYATQPNHPNVQSVYTVEFQPDDPTAKVVKYVDADNQDVRLDGGNPINTATVRYANGRTSVKVLVILKKSSEFTISGNTQSRNPGEVTGDDLKGQYTVTDANGFTAPFGTASPVGSFTMKSSDATFRGHPMANHEYTVTFIPRVGFSVEKYVRKVGNQEQVLPGGKVTLSESDTTITVIAKLKSGGATTLNVKAADPSKEPVEAANSETNNRSSMLTVPVAQAIRGQGMLTSLVFKTLLGRFAGSGGKAYVYTRLNRNDFSTRFFGTQTTDLGLTNISNKQIDDVIDKSRPSGTYRITLEGTDKFSTKVCVVKMGKELTRRGIRPVLQKYTDYRVLEQRGGGIGRRPPTNVRIGFKTALEKTATIVTGQANTVTFDTQDIQDGTEFLSENLTFAQIGESMTVVKEDGVQRIDQDKLNQCLDAAGA